MIQQPGPTSLAFAATATGGTDLITTTGGILDYVVLGLSLGEIMAIVGFVAVVLSIVVNVKALMRKK